MNYWKRYPGDYSRDTGHLSLAEHGAYALLLDTYYATEAPLPASMTALHRLCRAMTAEERAAVESVADQFFKPGSDGRRHNDRADKQIAKDREFLDSQAEKSRRAVEARQAKTPGSTPGSTPRLTPPTPTPTPSPEKDLAPTVHSHLAAPKRPSVPVKEIIDLYHELLPMCPQVRKLTAARKAQIEARWRSKDLPDLETWRDYFEFCAESKFLRGESPAGPGQRPFVADLEWLTKESNYAKVFERKYHK